MSSGRATHHRQPIKRAAEWGEGPASSQSLRSYLSSGLAEPARGRNGLAMAPKIEFGSPRGIHLRRRAAQAGPVGRAALRGRCPHPHHPRDRAEHPDRRLRDGHCDHPPWRSPWRRPAASASSTAISSPTRRPRGPPGEEVRVRHGGEPAHHPSRRIARRRSRADEAAQHLGRASSGRRQQRQRGKLVAS